MYCFFFELFTPYNNIDVVTIVPLLCYSFGRLYRGAYFLKSTQMNRRCEKGWKRDEGRGSPKHCKRRNSILSVSRAYVLIILTGYVLILIEFLRICSDIYNGFLLWMLLAGG